MALHLYTSNRMELLVEYLAMVLQQEKLPPLDSETIIVQSQGMARFLAMELAVRNRIWAGGDFPFPNAFLSNLFAQILEQDVSQRAWQRAPLAWRIYDILPSLLNDPEFTILAAYCQTPSKTFQLSQQISDIFDQYVLYRPEMIRDWTQGQDDHWQAILWRRLVADIEAPNRAEIFSQVSRTLAEKSPEDLPRRISLFGISSMAPQMVHIFALLAQHIQVNIFFLNPCQAEWSSIMTQAAITKVELDTGQSKEQHVENGNELLASMGHLGRDFLDLILDHHPHGQELFVPAEEHSLLGVIQDNILDLQLPTAHLERDDSIQLVSCHNPMREVEVLYDHLLHLLDGDNDLAPRDILVMAPDIGVYGPLVDAVFRGGDKMSLPYSIADESMREQECFAGLLQLLKTVQGRWRVTEVLALLEVPALCRSFDFSSDDLTQIKSWLSELHIHWGRDKRHRQQLGLPPSSEHSFWAGLNRLLLGFAMEGEELFNGILPYQGQDVDIDTASRFLSFYEALRRLSASMEAVQTPEEWSQVFLGVVDDFFTPIPEQEWQIAQLRTILLSLFQDAEQGGYSQPVGADVVEVWLKKALNLDLSPYGFLSGGITFCSLLPMRAIPFKVVCLLGMNDGDFPRNQVRPGFDLTARDYRKGDRVKRNDDRYLFLEALLSARKQLYVSYVGRSIVDNHEILPSVLVSELLEYMAACLVGVHVKDLVLQHGIQPFNPDYFNGVLPKSYSRENYQASVALLENRDGDGDFLDGLAISEPSPVEIDLDDFLSFWKQPAAFFCRRSLGLVWPREDDDLDDDEPFSLTGLGRYGLAHQCVAMLLEDKLPDLAKVRATGVLPQGIMGELGFGQVSSQATGLVERLKPMVATVCDPLQVILHCGDFRLEVYLDHLYGVGQVLPRVGGKIDGRHVLKGWIFHLVLQLLETDSIKETFLISEDETMVFGPVAGAQDILISLLELYQQGQQAPLAFFAKSSWEYAKTCEEKGHPAGLKKAMATFSPDFMRFSVESDDPAVRQCFGDGYVLDSDFAAVSRKVFEPLFEVIHHV